MMARPTAASAAATAITKNTKTCPPMPSGCASATNVKLTALSISSTHMKITIVFRRSRDRKSTRLNSSHSQISYAAFCLKKKKYAVRGQPSGTLSHCAAAHHNDLLAVAQDEHHQLASQRAQAGTRRQGCDSRPVRVPQD